MAPDQRRHCVGNAFVDLVKFMRNYEKAHGALPVRPDTRQILTQRVVLSEWYRLPVFHDLLRILDELIVKGDERKALEMGAQGGSAIRGLMKTYVVPKDPKSSVLAMRHAWRAHYDFGLVHFDDAGRDTIRFTLSDYPDIPMVHALMTAGWGICAARAAGSTTTAANIIDRPWKGADSFVYEIHL